MSMPLGLQDNRFAMSTLLPIVWFKWRKWW
jgi:hypothetical protein